MQGRGVRFGVLWGITLLSFISRVYGLETAAELLCSRVPLLAPGLGPGLGPATGGNNHEHSDNAMTGRRDWRGGRGRCRLLVSERRTAATTATTATATTTTTTTATTTAPKRIILRGVNFDFNKANIKAEFRPGAR